MSSVSGKKTAGAIQRGPNMGNLLNLERVPNLAPKFANKIGKTCHGYAVKYTATGVAVEVASLIDANGEPIVGSPGKGLAPQTISLVEFERRVALYNRPKASDRLFALKRKYELRLNKEFPKEGPASGEEADIQAWLGKIPFVDRVVLLKSQKDYEKSKSVPAKGT